MNIEERVKKAYDLHHMGYNCAQAVLGAYVDLFDLEMDQAMTIAYGFGGGVGMTREICGTLTGGAMALGLKYGKGEADVKQKEFEASHGSVICGELLGIRKTDKEVNRATCDDLIEEVVRLLEKYLID